MKMTDRHGARFQKGKLLSVDSGTGTCYSLVTGQTQLLAHFLACVVLFVFLT